jgi:SpoVK/Ycf46/Vps4 family AAA+-type ATPase
MQLNSKNTCVHERTMTKRKQIIVFQPSGVGKTQLIKAVASEAKNVTFMNVRIDSVLSKWLGESEKSIRALFEIARERSPSIIFIDEVDALCSSRSSDESESSRRLKNALLTEMDGMESGIAGANQGPPRVIVIGNTNQPHSLDTAFLRRFPKRIHVPLPKFRDRRSLIEQTLKGYNHSLTDENLEVISLETRK